MFYFIIICIFYILSLCNIIVNIIIYNLLKNPFYTRIQELQNKCKKLERDYNTKNEELEEKYNHRFSELEENFENKAINFKRKLKKEYYELEKENHICLDHIEQIKHEDRQKEDKEMEL